MNENILNFPFPHSVTVIMPRLAMFAESANHYVPLDSRMTLSQARKQTTSSAGSHDTVKDVVDDEWVRAAPICGKARPAEEDIAEVDVEAADGADETKKLNVYIRKLNRLN